MKEFSEKSKEELLYYVYALVDPRTDKIFYIGKGSGNRIFDHCNDAINEEAESLKLDLIREIIAEGHDVKLYILRHKLSEKEAFMVESVLIDFLNYSGFKKESQLTNITSGHHQWDRGIKTVDEVEITYACKKIEPKEGECILLVCLNRTFDSDSKNNNEVDLKEITCNSWVIDKSNADKINYVLGIYHGIVRSVIKVNGYKWVTDSKGRKRCSFEGDMKDDSEYLNKDVSDYPFGSGSSIKYINLPKKNSIRGGRDYSKYSVNGTGSYGKARMVEAVINKYIELNSNITIDKLKEIFPDKLQGTVLIEPSADNIKDMKRFYESALPNGTKFYISNQWGTQIDTFIKHVDCTIDDITVTKLQNK